MSPKRLVSLFVIVPLLALAPACTWPSSPIPVGCSASDLIAAINTANAHPNRTTIRLQAGCVYTLTAVDNEVGFGHFSPGESGGNGLPAITTPIVIIGDRDDPPIIHRSLAAGTPEFRFFFVSPQGDLTLEALMLVNGRNAMAGGAVASDQGSVTTHYVHFVSNESPGGAPYANTTGGGGGGALAVSGTTRVHNSSFTDNRAVVGGAISNSGALTIEESTLELNTARDGAAIFNAGTATVTGSEVVGNTAARDGGGILNTGILALEQVLFENNRAETGGGGAVANYIRDTSSPTTNLSSLTVTDCSFFGNSGFFGGAVNNQCGLVTITGGSLHGNTAEYWGGGVFSRTCGGGLDSVTLASVRIEANQARTGGGIFNAGRMTLTNATLAGNEAEYSGGAISNHVYSGRYGSLVVTASSFIGNTAASGAALANAGQLTVLNSTLSGNDAAVGAGLENNAGEALIVFSTIAGNSGHHGVGIYANAGNVSVRHSIVGLNTPYNCHVSTPNGATMPAQGANLSSDDSCPGFSIIADPSLGPLANHGGPTMTHSLSPGSPAIGAALDCYDNLGDPLLVDQRGGPRPWPNAGSCDLGAFEFRTQPSMPPAPLDDPRLRVDMSVNCRAGSSTRFSRLAFLAAGQEVPLVGVNASATWYVVRLPDLDRDCWVWAEAVTALGDLSRVPIVDDPPEPAVPLEPTDEPAPGQGCWVGSLTHGGQVCVVPCPPDARPGGACTP
jgi:hypothetical protein